MKPDHTPPPDSGTVVRLSADAKNARVRVLLDTGLEFEVSALEASHLQPGQVLSPEQAQRFCLEDQFRRARNDAFVFLSRRERSRREVQAHLMKKGYAKQTVAQVLKRLDEENYLNDDRFCALWIQSRQNTRPRGAYALRFELSQKGIGDEMIQRHVEQVDEPSAAWAAVQPKLKQWAGLDRRRFIARVGGFLQRRGFGSGIVRTTIDRAWNALAGQDFESPDDARFSDA